MASQTTTISIQEQSHHVSSFSFQYACQQSPLCVCGEGGYLRSRYRQTLTRTFLWKRRLIVLLPTTESTSLMLFESRESASPSLILEVNDRLRFQTVQHHPTHLNIISTFENFSGSDQPKITNNESSWRLKFASNEQAMFWKSLLESAAIARGASEDENLTTDDFASARGHVTHSTTPPNMTIVPNGNGVSIATTSPIFFAAPFLILFGAYLFGLIKGKDKEPVHFDESIRQDDRLSSGDQHGEDLAALATMIKRVIYLLRPPNAAPRPQMIHTNFQLLVMFSREPFTPDGLFPPGSLVFEHFWLCLPASSVLAVSMLSILSRVLDIRWVFAALLGTFSLLLGSDAYTNNWKHPLSCGLYWNFYGQSLFALCCLGASLTQVQRALGRRSRRQTISNRRKVASALSAGLASFGFPLTLRAIDERDGATCFTLACTAFVVFFTGLHFFGWARRDLIICGYAVGESIYQTSLVPANVASTVLHTLGDMLEQRTTCAELLLHLGRWVYQRLDSYKGRYLRVYQALRHHVSDAIDLFCDRIVHRFLRPAFAKMCQFLSAAFDCMMQSASATWRSAKYLGAIITQKANAAWSFIAGCFKHAIFSLGSFIMQAASIVYRYVVHPAIDYLFKFMDAVVTLSTKAMSIIGRKLSAAFDCMMQCALATWRSTKYLGAIITQKANAAWSFTAGCLKHAIFSLGSFIMQFASIVYGYAVDPAIDYLFKFVDAVVTLSTKAVSIMTKKLCSVLTSSGKYLMRMVFLPLFNFLRAACKACVREIRAMISLMLRRLKAFGTFLFYRLMLPSFHFLDNVARKCSSKVWGWAILTLQFLESYIAVPLLRACRKLFQELLRVTSRLPRAAAFVFSPIVKKYWQFIPAGLALNGSYLFARAAITEGAMVSRMNYAMGAWALFLVGCTIAQSVVASRNSALVRQHVVVKQSPLQYVDFYATYAISQVVSSGWHALSVSFDLVLRTCDFVVRKTCSLIWWLSVSLHHTIVKPISSSLWMVVSVVWNSPFFSMTASILALAAAYMMHYTKIRLALPGIVLDTTFFFQAVHAVSKFGSTAFGRLYVLIESLCEWVLQLLTDVYGPVVGADTSSPSVALSCWAFTSVMAKARNRFRIKSFAVPILFVYITGVAAASFVKAVCVTSLVWIALSLLVDRYEEQSQSRATIAFDVFRTSVTRRSRINNSRAGPRTRKRESASKDAMPKTYQLTECVICLDEFDTDDTCETQVLPCGHRFHGSCVQEWLHASNNHRCPICRRATGGVDRVLEIVF